MTQTGNMLHLIDQVQCVGDGLYTALSEDVTGCKLFPCWFHMLCRNLLSQLLLNAES